MKLLGMLIAFLGFSTDTYGTELEKYIVGQNPQDAGDVERLTYEFHRKQSDWRFLWAKLNNSYIVFLKPFNLLKNTKRVN